MVSYMHHLPLCLSPDDVWIVIMQGFCAYMNNNAEKLRKKFVDFKGKKLLTVIRDSGFMLRNGTDFESIFADFS